MIVKRFLPLLFVFSVMFTATESFANNPIQLLFRDATKAFYEKDFDRAIELYEKLNKIYPNFAPSYNYLGLAKKEKGAHNNEIIWQLNKAIELDPNYAQAYENLGKVYYNAGNFDEAEKNALKAVALDASLINSKLSLAWIYLIGKSEPRKAITYFQDVLNEQRVAYAYFGLGMAYMQDEQKFKVLEIITDLRSMDEDGLAGELEKMVRNNSYVPPRARNISSTSLKAPKRHVSTLVTNDKAAAATPVRLKSRMPSISPKQPDNNLSQNTYSGADRIKNLQQRRSTSNSTSSSNTSSSAQPKGSGY